MKAKETLNAERIAEVHITQTLPSCGEGYGQVRGVVVMFRMVILGSG